MSEQTLVQRLRLRAQIRRSITTRKSYAEGKPDRIADLLDEAADEITRLQNAYDDVAEQYRERYAELEALKEKP